MTGNQPTHTNREIAYVFENRVRKDMEQEKAKPRLDMDYVRALVILIAGVLVLISI